MVIIVLTQPESAATNGSCGRILPPQGQPQSGSLVSFSGYRVQESQEDV